MPAPLATALGLDVTVPVPSSGESPAPRSSLPGSERREGGRLDHFILGRKLGSGGMGTVHLARDASLDRLVAIKLLPDELALDPEAQARFIREAQAQARLSSARVVQIYFIGSVPVGDGGRRTLYFAMEHVDGESLEAGLDRGERLDPELARRLMREVAEGLRDAHRAGIVHRDIKPGNLLLDRKQSLKIADFGLAKPRDPKLGMTRQGTVMGTPYYMAPEQGRGEPLDHRADMYALGCTFYHLVGGAPPFDGPSHVAVIARHLADAHAPLRERNAAASPAFAAIIDRLMAKTPDRRYASYDELIAALEAAAPERVVPAGFLARSAAVAIDAALVSVLIAFVGWPGMIVHIAHVTLGHAYVGQTAAKYVLRLRVERLDGSLLGLPRSLLRTVAAMWLPFLAGALIFWAQGLPGLKGSIAQLAEFDAAKALVIPIFVGNLVLTLLYASGLLLAAVQKEKRALHDFLVGSRVVYRLAPPPAPAPRVPPSPEEGDAPPAEG